MDIRAEFEAWFESSCFQDSTAFTKHAMKSAYKAATEAARGGEASTFDPWVLYDPETNEIKMTLPEGQLAIFETEQHAKRAMNNNPGTKYKQVHWHKRPPAPVVPEGWRIEVDTESGIAWLYDADSGEVASYRDRSYVGGESRSYLGFLFLKDLLKGKQSAGEPRDLQYMAAQWDKLSNIAKGKGYKSAFHMADMASDRGDQ